MTSSPRARAETPTEAQANALRWLSDQTDGRALYAAVPENIIKPLRSMIGTRLVREKRMISNFLGIEITPAGRVAIAIYREDKL